MIKNNHSLFDSTFHLFAVRIARRVLDKFCLSPGIFSSLKISLDEFVSFVKKCDFGTKHFYFLITGSIRCG